MINVLCHALIAGLDHAVQGVEKLLLPLRRLRVLYNMARHNKYNGIVII